MHVNLSRHLQFVAFRAVILSKRIKDTRSILSALLWIDIKRHTRGIFQGIICKTDVCATQLYR